MMTPGIFPPPEKADAEGCLGWTPTLNVPMLIDAYTHGIFPWPVREREILWFTPPERGVLYLDRLHIPARLARSLRQKRFRLKISERFSDVIEHCSRVPRKGQEGTWITGKIRHAYRAFHDAGYVHSFEASNPDGELVGGMYGVSLGRVFCGESMFHLETDASKFALLSAIATLRKCGVVMLDTQVMTPLLGRFGAIEIPRARFLEELSRNLGDPIPAENLRANLTPAEELCS